MKGPRVIFLCLGLLHGVLSESGLAQPQEHHIQLFDYGYGIRPGSISGLARDQDGFLWILYPRSVQRFDGRDVCTYQAGPNLLDMFCDPAGRLWVRSLEGIWMFDKVSDAFLEVPVAEREHAGRIGPVFALEAGGTCAITETGFYQFSDATNVFEKMSAAVPVPPPYNVRSFSSLGNVVFIGHDRKIYRYDFSSGELDSLPDRSVMRIHAISQDSALISSWELSSYWYDFGESAISEVRLPQYLLSEGNRSVSVRGVARTGAHELVLAAREGLFSCRTGSGEMSVIRLSHKGSQLSMRDYANAVIADNDDAIWLATVDGVARVDLSGRQIGLKRIRQANDMLPVGVDNVRSFAEDEHGNIWIATGDGFARWERDRGKMTVYTHSESSTDRLAHPSIRGIVCDGRYVILAPADRGIWLFDPDTEKYRRPAYADAETRVLSERDFFDGVTTLDSGDHLFPGRDATYVLDGKSYQLRRFRHPADEENANFVFQGRNGIVWMTTMRGLHVFDASLNYLQRVDMPGEDVFVSSACVLHDDRLLYATHDGVFAARYENGRVDIIKYTNVFDGIFIAILYQDSGGVLWAASENGIYRYDPGNRSLVLFDYADNVQGYGFNGNAFLMASDGKLYLGGMNGINYLNPHHFTNAPENLDVFIHSVRNAIVDSLTYPLSRQAVIDYADRALEIEFVCPYFKNPDKVQYRYMIDGLDPDWVYNGSNRNLRITAIPPGQYRLQVEASMNGADWYGSQQSFAFLVKSPFWQTPWFYALVAFGLGGSVLLIVRNRNLQIAEKQKELEAEKAINYFSGRMVEQQSVSELLQNVAESCVSRLGFESCRIFLGERSVDLTQAACAKNDACPDLPDAGDGSVTALVAHTGQSLVRQVHIQKGEHSGRQVWEMAVPIVTEGRVLGVITCSHSVKRYVTQRHVAMLSTIASLCAAKMIRVKADEQKQESERVIRETRQQMADAEMQALRAQMNPHFIFNSLNSINRYIVKSDQATASLYLTRFAKLIRLILDNSNNKVVTLSNELEALRLYIEMESIRFEQKFSYEIRVDDDVHPDHIDVPPLIIQPYVENAIWHGLLHKESPGHLSVRISLRSPSMLECRIEDNGVGRVRAKELRSKSASASKSLGMKLTENRLSLLNQYAEWETAVGIEDLVDEKGDPLGTVVILKIPLDT